MLSRERLEAIVSLIPDEWLSGYENPRDDIRGIYTQFLTARLAASEIFVEEALRAREALV
jgi:hypothetical protein